MHIILDPLCARGEGLLWLAVKEWGIWLAADGPLVVKKCICEVNRSHIRGVWKPTHKCGEVYKWKAHRQLNHQQFSFHHLCGHNKYVCKSYFICKSFLSIWIEAYFVCIENEILYWVTHTHLFLYIFTMLYKIHLWIWNPDSWTLDFWKKDFAVEYLYIFSISVCIYPLWNGSGSIIEVLTNFHCDTKKSWQLNS